MATGQTSSPYMTSMEFFAAVSAVVAEPVSLQITETMYLMSADLLSKSHRRFRRLQIRSLVVVVVRIGVADPAVGHSQRGPDRHTHADPHRARCRREQGCADRNPDCDTHANIGFRGALVGHGGNSTARRCLAVTLLGVPTRVCETNPTICHLRPVGSIFIMRINIITIFPEFFASPLETSLVGKARGDGVLEVVLLDLRDTGSASDA